MSEELDKKIAEKVRNNIEGALALLGTGECKINTCDACKFETKESIILLKAALAALAAKEE